MGWVDARMQSIALTSRQKHIGRCVAGEHIMRAVRTPYCIFQDNRLNKKIFDKQHIQKTDNRAA